MHIKILQPMAIMSLLASIFQPVMAEKIDASDPTKIYSFAEPDFKYTNF